MVNGVEEGFMVDFEMEEVGLNIICICVKMVVGCVRRFIVDKNSGIVVDIFFRMVGKRVFLDFVEVFVVWWSVEDFIVDFEL